MRTRLRVLALVAISVVVVGVFSVFDVVGKGVANNSRINDPVYGGVGSGLTSGCVPSQFNYQGYLLDKELECGVTDTLVMHFRIFSQAQGGTELWSETHGSVRVLNGLFSVVLGDSVPIPHSIFDGSVLWLQTEIGEEVLSPRKELVSVGYSFRSCHAETAGYAPPTPVGPILGAWETKSVDTVYQASTDGFVLVYTDYNDVTFEILTDSADPPATIRQKHSDYGGPGWKSAMCPVRKNDYWKVAKYNSGTMTVYWIPLGS